MLRLAHISLWIGILLPASAFARETVYLKSGFSLEADSHKQQDQSLILFLGTGTLEVATDQVTRIEPIPDANRAPAGARPSESATPLEILNNAADTQGVDEDFVRSVAKVESGLRQQSFSPKGAIGLMQLMPATAAGLGVNPGEISENARGGAKYLRDLLIRYHGNSALALAAYNAGPEAVAKFGGIPPYPETERYIVLVLREYERQSKARLRALSAAPGAKAATPNVTALNKTSATR